MTRFEAPRFRHLAYCTVIQIDAHNNQYIKKTSSHINRAAQLHALFNKRRNRRRVQINSENTVNNPVQCSTTLLSNF